MITLIPTEPKPKRMPPLTRRSQATLDVLLSPVVPEQGYKTLLQRNNELIDDAKRHFNLAITAFPVGAVCGFIAGLYCR